MSAPTTGGTAYASAFRKLMRLEGGFVYHRVKDDRGGDTFAGITRRSFPDWPGWGVIDGVAGWQPNTAPEAMPPELTGMVADFYHARFWTPLRCDELNDRDVAAELFCASVVMGRHKATLMAQMACHDDVIADGVLGSKTIAAINEFSPAEYLLRYKIARILRYAAICRKDKSQRKFLLGWIHRALDEVAI